MCFSVNKPPLTSSFRHLKFLNLIFQNFVAIIHYHIFWGYQEKIKLQGQKKGKRIRHSFFTIWDNHIETFFKSTKTGSCRLPCFRLHASCSSNFWQPTPILSFHLQKKGRVSRTLKVNVKYEETSEDMIGQPKHQRTEWQFFFNGSSKPFKPV